MNERVCAAWFCGQNLHGE